MCSNMNQFIVYLQIHGWLQNFCRNNEIRYADLSIIHKLLFSQRIRTQKSFLFEGIAKQVEKVLGQHEEVRIQLSTPPKTLNKLIFSISSTFPVKKRSQSRMLKS